MTAQRHIRTWYLIHKWTSLVSTAFLLLICLTGLPLIFSDEIEQWLSPHTFASLPPEAPRANLDRLVGIGRQMFPGQIVTSIFVDDDEPQVYLWMATSFAVFDADPMAGHFIRFDARTAQILEVSDPSGQERQDFMSVVLALHQSLLARLPGELFLGLMGLLFVVATVSGVALYAPFMKNLAFGTVRTDRSRRLQWLDWHNLLGIATLAWLFVAGATGVMNELSTPLFGIWKLTEVKAALAPWQGQSTPPPSQLSSVQAALDTAQRAAPGTTFGGIQFPGGEDSTPYHYVLWGHGSSNLTSKLFTPVLVDARTGALALVARMPWYLRALEVSRPLHFGNYGGMPLKILWAMLDMIAIGVLGTGLYLWFARRKQQAERFKRFAEVHPATGARKNSRATCIDEAQP